MTLYSAVLFVHIVSALGIIAALSLTALSQVRLRKAATSGEVGFWLKLAPGVPALAIVSLAFLLLSGIYMTKELDAWTLAWPRVAVGALFLIGPLGAISARRLSAIQCACAESKPNETEILSMARDPFLVISMNLRIALVLGIVLLMTAKPELRESLGIVVSSIFLGIVSALPILWGRGSASSIARADSHQ